MAAQSLGSFDAIIASPLLRASETAAIISAQMGVGPVVTVDDLKERDAGEWSGLTRSDIEEQYPDYLKSGKRPPAYELDEEMLPRVRGALTQIIDTIQADSVLVVCHGGVVYALEEELGEQWKRLTNLGGRWIECSDGRFSLGERAKLIDDKLSSSQPTDIF